MDADIGFLTYPVSSLRHFMLTAFVHSVLEPIWYFFIPSMTVYLFQKLFRRKWKIKNLEGSVENN